LLLSNRNLWDDVDFKSFVKNTNAADTEIEKNGETYGLPSLPQIEEVELKEQIIILILKIG
jgi:hypothetical protein